jgi:heme-degrading monooxygenase HmoA
MLNPGQGDGEMIKIHIRRNIPEDKKEDLLLLIMKLRSMSMGKPGYISGETLRRLDIPGESLVVTKWQSVHYWNQWFQSAERSEIQNKIDQLLGEETRYEIYEYDPM